MSRTPHKPPLALDMDFGEALQRFAKTSLKDLPENVRLKKGKTNKPSQKPRRDKPVT